RPGNDGSRKRPQSRKDSRPFQQVLSQGAKTLWRCDRRVDPASRREETTLWNYDGRVPALDRSAERSSQKKAQEQLEDRFVTLFQRRHDCIHNCDRPRRKPQLLAASEIVLKVIQDVAFLVSRCDEHINTEFRQFLTEIGCNAATIAAARY